MFEQREIEIFKSEKRGLDFENIESKIKSEDLKIKNHKKRKKVKIIKKESKYCKSCLKIEKKKKHCNFCGFYFCKNCRQKRHDLENKKKNR